MPVDLVLHLQAALAVPVHTTLTCRALPQPCSNRPLQQVRLLQQQGRVQILDLVRGGHGLRQPGQAPQQVLSSAVSTIHNQALETTNCVDKLHCE